MSAPAAPPPSRDDTAQARQHLRIGDVARLLGTTPRTIRYYEELGLLAEPTLRPSGRIAPTAKRTSTGWARSCA